MSRRIIKYVKSSLMFDRSDLWLVIVFSLGISVLSFITPLSVDSLIYTVSYSISFWPILILSIFVFLFSTISSLIRILQSFAGEFLTRQLFARFSKHFSNRFLSADFSSFDGQNLNAIMISFFAIMAVQASFVTLFLDTLIVIFTTLLSILMLWLYNFSLMFFSVIFIAMLVLIMILISREAIKKRFADLGSRYLLIAWFCEMAKCYEIFYFMRGRYYAEKKSIDLTLQSLHKRESFFLIIFRQILLVFSLESFFNTLFLVLGGYLVINQKLTIGQLLAVVLIINLITSAFSKLTRSILAIYDLETGLGRLEAIECLKEEPNEVEILSTNINALSITTELVYSSKNQKIHINSGESVALTGKQGVGKSYLLETLACLRVPEFSAGSLQYNGISVYYLNRQSLRSMIAYIKTGTVFSGTLLENLRVGNENISVAEINKLIEFCGFKERLNSFPLGLLTPISLSGFPFSSSDIIYINLMRSLLANPKLLLIDGILDYLNPDYSNQMISYLFDPSHLFTLVVVTNREYIINYCDRIVEWI